MACSRGTLLDPLEEEKTYNKARYSHSLCSRLSLLIYFAHFCRGFTLVCLWGSNVNDLGIYFSVAPCIMIPKLFCVCIFANVYFYRWCMHTHTQKVESLLLTSIIGRGGHLRGWRSKGTSQAFCQAWQVGGPHRVLAAPPRTLSHSH